MTTPATSSDVPPVPVVAAGGTLGRDGPARFDIYAHCGVKLLGNLNGRCWITDEPGSDAYNWLPTEWAADPTRPYGSLRAELRVSEDGSSITARFNKRSIVYRPANGDPENLGLLCD